MSARCYGITATHLARVIDFPHSNPQGPPMRRIAKILIVGCLVAVTASSASAACFADYKAKQENPLRLHYGVVEVNVQPCQMSSAVSDNVSRRVAAGGWMLLQIESVFDKTGLEARKRDAGEFYLRF